MLKSALVKHSLATIILFILSIDTFSQTPINGTVTDSETREPLQYCNVWIEGTSKGTSTDKHGKFTLYLEPGKVTLIASYMGYKSQRRDLTITHAPMDLEIKLVSMNIQMPEVTITPEDNPALRIIRLAIENKEKRKEKLLNYSLTSHSKLVVDIHDAPGFTVGRGGRRGITVGIGSSTTDTSTTKDTTDGPLKAILETQTDAYWAKPNRYKEIVKARKQSAFIPSQANIMISSFFIIDFSADELKLSDKALVVGPISNAGLRNYYYKLKGTTQLDGKTIFMIDITPLNDYDPLLKGTLYIAEGSYALMMVDVELNEAARPTFFKHLAFRQNFRLFENDFWMPVDVVANADIELSLIIKVKVGIEGFSVLQDYAINRQINEDFFDRTRIKVLKEADERDSVYWAGHQLIPNTPEEIEAYVQSDSVKTAMLAEQNSYGVMDFLTTGKTFSGDEARFSTPGLLKLYHFNRVEGHALFAPFSWWQPFDPIDVVSIDGGYGFSDKRWKYSARLGVRLLQSPMFTISGTLYDQLGNIDENDDFWERANVTLSNLFFKYDYKDYFYTKGWQASARADVLFLFPTTVRVERQTYTNAVKNSDWSITRQSWSYRENPPINEGSILSSGARLSFDNRDFIDNAGVIRRFGGRNHTPTIGIEYNRADLEGEVFSFTRYSASLNGRFQLGRIGTTSYRLFADWADGKLPTQRLLNLPGSVNHISEGWRFHTLDFREFGGDRRVMALVQHDFDDQIFRWLHIPFLESSGFGLLVYGKGGWTSLSDETLAMQKISIGDARQPFFEIGFGIDRILTIFRVDLAWRLSHYRDGRNFFIGISTPFTN